MNTTKKGLIAYYSRKGENYLSGQIVDLEKGNTAIVAEKIQALTGYDLFEIDTVESYPVDYHETTRVAQRELRAQARPALTATVDRMDDYDVIYLGYPNWWSSFPMTVATFLESYDFGGKTILPFCTHEGSGMGGERDIHKLCPTAQVEKGLAIAGSRVKEADASIKAWIGNQK
jgi:flavodoxin